MTYEYPYLQVSNEQKDGEIAIYNQTMLVDVVQAFQRPDTKHQALPCFVVAASLQLAIAQERANLFPNSDRQVPIALVLWSMQLSRFQYWPLQGVPRS